MGGPPGEEALEGFKARTGVGVKWKVKLGWPLSHPRSGAVALVIMGHGAGSPLFQRQPGPGSVEGLDLARLFERQDTRESG